MKRMSDKTIKIIVRTMYGCSTILLIVALVILVGLKKSNSSPIFILVLCSLLVNVINIFVFEANAKKSRKSDKEEKGDKEEPKK